MCDKTPFCSRIEVDWNADPSFDYVPCENIKYRLPSVFGWMIVFFSGNACKEKVEALARPSTVYCGETRGVWDLRSFPFHHWPDRMSARADCVRWRRLFAWTLPCRISNPLALVPPALAWMDEQTKRDVHFSRTVLANPRAPTVCSFVPGQYIHLVLEFCVASLDLM